MSQPDATANAQHARDLLDLQYFILSQEGVQMPNLQQLQYNIANGLEHGEDPKKFIPTEFKDYIEVKSIQLPDTNKLVIYAMFKYTTYINDFMTNHIDAQKIATYIHLWKLLHKQQ